MGVSQSQATLTIGDARVAILNLGHLQVDLAEWLGRPPDDLPSHLATDFHQPVLLSMQAGLIQTPEATILVDPGRYDEIPAREWSIAGYTPPPDLPAQLATLGVSPAEVTDVVITHAHFDHFSGCAHREEGNPRPLFPRAKHYLARADWQMAEVQAALGQADSLEATTLGLLRESGQLRLVDGSTNLSPGVDIFAAPGESPGHQVLRLQRQGQSLYFLGDLFHHPVEVARPALAPRWADAAALAESRKWLVERALAEDALLVASHIAGAGRLAGGPEGAAWEPAQI